jgi:hypothetical protein
MFLHCAVGKSPTRVSRELNTRQAVPALMRIARYLNASALSRTYRLKREVQRRRNAPELSRGVAVELLNQTV